MRILVTGGTGFIGSHVVSHLAAQPGVETSVLARPGSDLWRLRALGLNPGKGPVALALADLKDGDSLDAVVRRIRPPVILHLGALVYHHFGPERAAEVEAVNRHAAVRLQKALAEVEGGRFVAAGSCFEYGPQDRELLDEATPCRPVYDYAVAKLRATEALLEQGSVRGVDTVVLRIFSPYGPLEDPRRIVPQLISAGFTGQRLALTGGEQVRDYISVEDVARAFVTAALRPILRRPQAIYNVCSGTGDSLRQLARTLELILGQPLPLDWGKLPYRLNEMMRLVGDNRRIREDLDWSPCHDLEQGLRHTVTWWRSALAPSAFLARRSA